MAEGVESVTSEPEARPGGCLLWFFWGTSLGVLTIFSLVLVVLLAISLILNVYLGWEMSGLEVAISRPGNRPAAAPPLIPTRMLAAIPTQTPASTPVPDSTASPVEVQLATLSALATEVAASRSGNTPTPVLLATPTPLLAAMALSPTPPASPTAVPTVAALNTLQVEADISAPPTDEASAPATTDLSEADHSVTAAEAAEEFVPPVTSSNSYALMPIEGQRESRPAEEHGDLNLKLRDPQPIEVELSLVDIPGSGIDPNAPQLSSVFEANFVKAYTVHDWDWGCNCKGQLLREDHLVLVGIKTTPGQPIFIPKTERDIYDGKYYAVVLYADEDSLTFLYARAGSVVKGYTVHYLGLRTDPNLLALFRESKGSELPGLSLDTPVGVAADELIVAIRDNGKFLDARSRQDWWK